MQDLHKLLIILAGLALAVTWYCNQSKERLSVPLASTMPPMTATTSTASGLQPVDDESTDFATFTSTAPQPCSTAKPFSA